MFKLLLNQLFKKGIFFLQMDWNDGYNLCFIVLLMGGVILDWLNIDREDKMKNVQMGMCIFSFIVSKIV